MCGVFGFISDDNSGPDLDRLREIARVTQTRGTDAYGFAWIDSRNRMHAFRQTGAIGDNLDTLDMLGDARLIIGHTRYATQGDPDDNINNHPHPCDGGWLVHNGMIPDYERIMRRMALRGVSRCDSELLALIIERGRGNMAQRCASAARSVGNVPLVTLGLWRHPRPRIIAVRRGNPLHFGNAGGALYLASLARGLPGAVRPAHDGYVYTFDSAGYVIRPVDPCDAGTDPDESDLFAASSRRSYGF